MAEGSTGEKHGGVAEVTETRVRTYPLNSRRLTARVVNRIACSLGLPKSPLADARQMIEGQLAETREPQNVQVDVDTSEPEETATIRLRDEDGVFLQIEASTPEEEEEEATTIRGSPSKAGEPETLEEPERRLEDEAAGGGGARTPTSSESRELVDTSQVHSRSSSDPDIEVEQTHVRELERRLLETSGRVTGLETQVESMSAHATELEEQVEAEQEHSSDLQAELERVSERNTQLLEAVSMWEIKGRESKDRCASLWRMNCEQLSECDCVITAKEEEKLALKAHVASLERNLHARPGARHETTPTSHPERKEHATSSQPGRRMHRGGSVGRWSMGPRTGPDCPRTSLRESPRVAGVVGSGVVGSGVVGPGVVGSGVVGSGVVGSGVVGSEVAGLRAISSRALDSRVVGLGAVRSQAAGPEARRAPAAHIVQSSVPPTTSGSRRGKAPPIDPFNGEARDIAFDDWVPALRRAAEWNGWTDNETLMQLAGHMRGRALQEWNLLPQNEKASLEAVISSLRSRLDPCSRVVAAQDFRHASQHEKEPVADYIRRLEQLFRVAYGRDTMSDETRETLLHSQLQEGLSYELMKAPAVSGSHTYRELCLAAKNEEKRLAELLKRRQYLRTLTIQPCTPTDGPLRKTQEHFQKSVQENPRERRPPDSNDGPKRCYNCGKGGHLARDCWGRRTESRGGNGVNFRRDGGNTHGGTKLVQTDGDKTGGGGGSATRELLSYLLPDDSSDDSGGEVHVRQVRISDSGSRQRYVRVLIEGVPVQGTIDSGSDITIIGRDLFRRIAAVARLRKSQLLKPDKTPKTYDGRTFRLDGRIDLDITFDGTTMKTPLYVNLNAPEPLLLAEGVCRQLGIIAYHPDVTDRTGRRQLGKEREGRRDPSGQHAEENAEKKEKQEEATRKKYTENEEKQARTAKWEHQFQTIEEEKGDSVVPVGKQARTTKQKPQFQTTGKEKEDSMVPVVRVHLIRSVDVLPRQCTYAQIKLEDVSSGTILVEPDSSLTKTLGIMVGSSLLQPDKDGIAYLPMWNPAGFTRRLEAGELLGRATEATVVCPSEIKKPAVRTISANQDRKEVSWQRIQRQKKLRRLLGEPDLPSIEKETLLAFLADHHHAFSLEDGERGETDLIQMEIETGDAYPKRQPARRLPFALRQEVARQLREMQSQGVIQPSKSPWASPVVLVKKKDGTHRFCVDYRQLNSITKTDNFPLPRIDDLLDQLGKSKYFSSIDLASGFWQIQMHSLSQEKTAFVTPQGLYEFRVMPFGLKNAPGVFQRLMQQVVSSLNPGSGPDFVSVYLDDILVFSRNLKEHLEHLRLVIERLVEVGLKLKPSKCKFVQHELEYLGHIVSRGGLRTNPKLTEAVAEFPRPRSVHDVRRFLGLASYYRRFIFHFAKIARPLHKLTCKDTRFAWSPECQMAFQELKQRLSSAPVLAYPNFDAQFVLETDASIKGLGAVLSQAQEGGKLHPVGYASRALSPSEVHYGITDLETLAVVWAISHFNHYLYGNRVVVYTDHTAVKSVLEAANPSGKHARWWTRVYGRGIKDVTIRYRAGRENINADALSRSPKLPAPDVGIAQDEVQVSSMSSAISHTNGGEYPLTSHLPQTLGDSSKTATDNSLASTVPVDCQPATPLSLDRYQLSNESTPRDLQVQRVFQETALDKEVPVSIVSSMDTGVMRRSRSKVLEITSHSASLADSLAAQQAQDPEIAELIAFLKHGQLPDDNTRARKMAMQQSLFAIVDNVLYYIDHKRGNRKRAAVPLAMRTKVMEETHSGPYGGHFSGQRTFNALVPSWWWEGMFSDVVTFAKACPECAVTTGSGRRMRPPLHPIPVHRPFQLLAIDVMDLPLTEDGNRHVVVIQDLFTKWPFIFAVPDQKASRIARLLAEEVIPSFGVPESLLSDRGTNFLSNLIMDLCKMLGISKLNTTAYHPQCDGAVERFNRTLKSILRKHTACFGSQWDRYLPGVLWAYRNTPHTSTGEKPSFLLYGVDCRTPTEAAYLPISEVCPTNVEDYREELMISLSSARELAATTIQKAQSRYKGNYDRERKTKESALRVGDWILVHFPQDEVGKNRKLARPWHGPYRVIQNDSPDVTCVKVYFPQHGTIRVHQSRVCRCPTKFPAGYFWYGGQRKGPGRPPKWVDTLLASGQTCTSISTGEDKASPDGPSSEEEDSSDTPGADQLDGVEELQPSGPERSKAPRPAPMPATEGADSRCSGMLHTTPKPQGRVTPEGNQPEKQPAPARPRKDGRLRGNVRPPDRL